MSQRVYCIAQFQPKPGKLEALFRVLQALEPDTLREDGCVQYRITRHIPSPFAEGESYPLVFNEIWANMEVFEEHCQKPYIKAFFEQKDLLSLEKGRPVEIEFPDGIKVSGKISRLYSATLAQPPEFQKKYEPTHRNVVVDVILDDPSLVRDRDVDRLGVKLYIRKKLF